MNPQTSIGNYFGPRVGWEGPPQTGRRRLRILGSNEKKCRAAGNGQHPALLEVS